MQISHFHRRENFITLYWFRNNSLTSTPSFSLHINLSLFKVLSSFFNWLLWSVLYCRLLRDCLLYMQLCLSWHKADICFLHVFRYCLGVQKCLHISLKLNIMMVLYNAKYLLHSPWASTDFWKWLFICQFFSLFQNQVCINIEWYNGTESIMLDQWLPMEERCYDPPPALTPGHLVISREIFDGHEFMDRGCYWHVGDKGQGCC